MDDTSLRIEKFNKDLCELIENSGLHISTVYYIVKTVFLTLENGYKDYLIKVNNEKILSENNINGEKNNE